MKEKEIKQLIQQYVVEIEAAEKTVSYTTNRKLKIQARAQAGTLKKVVYDLEEIMREEKE